VIILSLLCSITLKPKDLPRAPNLMREMRRI
jgi:hypothetical protein